MAFIVTGDTHGTLDTSKLIEFFGEHKDEYSKDDYLIICGDVGVCGFSAQREAETRKVLRNLPVTTLFVDGNHENFDRLNAYPVEMWNGGKVHKIRDSVIHLMRGQVFQIEGKKIFTFGGASSHDIDGGILEVNDPEYQQKKKLLDSEGDSYRINRVSWWKEEMPSQEEIDFSMKTLEEHGNKVDYIITHCCPQSVASYFSQGRYKPDKLTKYFNRLSETVEFKKWFFGHYHNNRNVTANELLLWEQIIRIS